MECWASVLFTIFPLSLYASLTPGKIHLLFSNENEVIPEIRNNKRKRIVKSLINKSENDRTKIVEIGQTVAHAIFK